jgi:hypothetical protein
MTHLVKTSLIALTAIAVWCELPVVQADPGTHREVALTRSDWAMMNLPN